MTFEEFVNYMFVENCMERRAWGEIPYPNVSEYFSAGTNSSFLIQKWRSEYAEN